MEWSWRLFPEAGNKITNVDPPWIMDFQRVVQNWTINGQFWPPNHSLCFWWALEIVGTKKPIGANKIIGWWDVWFWKRLWAQYYWTCRHHEGRKWEIYAWDDYRISTRLFETLVLKRVLGKKVPDKVQRGQKTVFEPIKQILINR